MVNFKMALEDVRLLFEGALNAGNRRRADECVEDEVLGGMVSRHMTYQDYMTGVVKGAAVHLCGRHLYRHCISNIA